MAAILPHEHLPIPAEDIETEETIIQSYISAEKATTTAQPTGRKVRRVVKKTIEPTTGTISLTMIKSGIVKPTIAISETSKEISTGVSSNITVTKPSTTSNQHVSSPYRSNFSSTFARGASRAIHRILGDGDNGHDDDDDHDGYDYNEDSDDGGQGDDSDQGDEAEHDHGSNGTEDHHNSDATGQRTKSSSAMIRGPMTGGQSAAPMHRVTHRPIPGQPVRKTSSQNRTKSSTMKPTSQPHVSIEQVSTDTLNEKQSIGSKSVSGASVEESVNEGIKLFLGIGMFAAIIKLFNILFPVFFLALGILNVVQIGQPEEASLPAAVQNAKIIAITVWPIMFAAVATQSLKAYGTFQAERGIKLMLLHSTSFSSAIKQPMLLRRLDWMSVGLFVLWALSPLASQGLQRMAYTVPANTVDTLQVNYTSVSGFIWSSGAGRNSQWVPIQGMFAGALMSSTRVIQSPQDSWGNPKVPKIELLNNSDGEGWFQVDTANNETTWSSLLGVPLSISSQDFETGSQFSLQFSVDVGYFNFDCTPFQKVPAASFNDSNYDRSPTYTVYVQVEEGPLNEPGDTYSNTGNLLWAFGQEDGITNGSISNDNYILSTCAYSFTTIEAQIKCLSQEEGNPSCAVQKIKTTNNSALVQANGLLSSSFFTGLLVGSLPELVNGTRTIQEGLLATPNNVLNSSSPSLAMDAKVFSTNVGLLVNTLYQSAIGGDAYLVGLTGSTVGIAATDSTITNTSLVWAVSIPWIVVFFFSVVTILLIAIADIFWEAYTISPDFLGFASNIVRNNQSLRKGFASRKLSGHEKARAMSNLRVILQDMSPEKAVGKIGLAPANSNSSKLQRKRNYAS